MVYVLNEAGFFGIIITGLTQNVTGSLFLTMMLLLILLIVVALAMRIPPIVVTILYLPLIITLAATSSDYLTLISVTLVYAGWTIGSLLYPGSY